MAWWKIVLIVLGSILGGGVLDLVVLWVIAAITEHRMKAKYPDWKDRGGGRP